MTGGAMRTVRWSIRRWVGQVAVPDYSLAACRGPEEVDAILRVSVDRAAQECLSRVRAEYLVGERTEQRTVAVDVPFKQVGYAGGSEPSALRMALLVALAPLLWWLDGDALELAEYPGVLSREVTYTHTTMVDPYLTHRYADVYGRPHVEEARFDGGDAIGWMLLP